MPLDPYSTCPGGTGKKIKFCCSDMVPELDKMSRLIEADQRQGCLDHIEQMERKHGQRACLLSAKASLELTIERFDAAEATAKAFVALCPQNATALALRAMTTQSSAEAVGFLQDAVEVCDTRIPGELPDAISQTAAMLLEEGDAFSALAHGTLAVMFDHDNQELLSNWMALRTSPRVPLFARDGVVIESAPSDAPWRNDYEAAVEPTRGGRWREAERRVAELAERVGDAPVVWRALGSLRAALLDRRGAAAAYARVAGMNVPHDDAVEARAMSLLLGEQVEPEWVDRLVAQYRIQDFDRAMAALAADKRVLRRGDMDLQSREGEPPPRMVLEILDRPMPEKFDSENASDLPRMLAAGLVYGRETDREPRVELVMFRSFANETESTLRDALGDALGEKLGEEVVGRAAANQVRIHERWRVPPGTPNDRVAAIAKNDRRQLILEVWPTLPQPNLGNKTVVEMAADPATRPQAEALVLIEEMAAYAGGATDGDEWRELRVKLGMPPQDAIDPAGVDISRLPLSRLHRLEVEKLSDEQALSTFRRAMMTGHRFALWMLGPSVATRPGLTDRADPAEIYQMLADLAGDPDQMLGFIERQRTALEDSKRSCAPADLAEMRIHLMRGDAENFSRLLRHLQSRHSREPSVAREMMQLLHEAGLVTADGRPVGLPAAAPSAFQEADPAESGKLWTPGGETAARGKPAIWTPGMD